MNFNSLDEAIAYIENAVSDAMPQMGEHMTDIMKEEIDKQIYSHHGNNTGTRTGQLGNSANVVAMDKNSVTTEYLDNGSWTSVKTGEKFFPLEGFLSTSVWAPGGGYYYADPHTESLFKCIDEIPNELKMFLMSRGIPVI